MGKFVVLFCLLLANAFALKEPFLNANDKDIVNANANEDLDASVLADSMSIKKVEALVKASPEKATQRVMGYLKKINSPKSFAKIDQITERKIRRWSKTRERVAGRVIKLLSNRQTFWDTNVEETRGSLAVRFVRERLQRTVDKLLTNKAVRRKLARDLRNEDSFLNRQLSQSPGLAGELLSYMDAGVVSQRGENRLAARALNARDLSVSQKKSIALALLLVILALFYPFWALILIIVLLVVYLIK